MTNDHQLFISDQARFDLFYDCVPMVPAQYRNIPILRIALWAGSYAKGVAIYSRRVQDRDYRERFLMLI